MSQLKNTTTVFQNNDLVTAAKLNSLVNDTSLDVGAVTEQAAPSDLTGNDVVLGYEAATGSLVAIPINDLKSTGDAPITTDSIISPTDSDLAITQNQNLRSINIAANGNASGISLISQSGQVVIGTSYGDNKTTAKTLITFGPFEVNYNIRVIGQSTVANMSSIAGSPIINFTCNNHGFLGGSIWPIELIGPTAEFTGLFEITNVTANTFVITLPANATTTYTNTPVTIARPSIQTLQLAYLSRLTVQGAARFQGTSNFLLPPQYVGNEIKPQYEYFVQTRNQAVLTSGWGGAQNTANLYGTKISALDITFTPKKAGNTVVLEWDIFGESTYSHDTVFLVTRTPNSGAGAGVAVALPNAVDASNNTWSGVTQTYDANDATTPTTIKVKIVDFNSLGVSSTYSVHFRAANNRTSTFHLNRSVNSAGALDHETGMSVGHARELYV